MLSVDNPSQSGYHRNSHTMGISSALFEGQDYLISCPNGTRVFGTWNGEYFKVKNPVAGGSCKWVFFFFLAKFCIFLLADC